MREGERREGPHSGALTGLRLDAFGFALPTIDHSAKRADDADECPAIYARVALGRTFLVIARSADHRVSFTELLGHVVEFSARPARRPDAESGRSANLYHGPHLTTRFAA